MAGSFDHNSEARSFRKIRLTRAVLAELNHKLEIFAYEADLHESYGFSLHQAEAMRNRFAKEKPGVLNVTESEADVIYGELENAADIEQANADSFFRGGNHNRAATLRKAANEALLPEGSAA